MRPGTEDDPYEIDGTNPDSAIIGHEIERTKPAAGVARRRNTQNEATIVRLEHILSIMLKRRGESRCLRNPPNEPSRRGRATRNTQNEATIVRLEENLLIMTKSRSKVTDTKSTERTQPRESRRKNTKQSHDCET